LSRILGLVSLIEKSDRETKEEELITHLKLSANELDDVVKRINSAIDNGNHFGRDHF
jgi:Trp operon repressor